MTPRKVYEYFMFLAVFATLAHAQPQCAPLVQRFLDNGTAAMMPARAVARVCFVSFVYPCQGLHPAARRTRDAYARRHGYGVHEECVARMRVPATGDENTAAQYHKIDVMRAALANETLRARYDYLLWWDADIVVMNCTPTLDHFLQRRAIGTVDVAFTDHNIEPNSGAFFLRLHSAHAARFVERWRAVIHTRPVGTSITWPWGDNGALYALLVRVMCDDYDAYTGREYCAEYGCDESKPLMAHLATFRTQYGVACCGHNAITTTSTDIRVRDGVHAGLVLRLVNPRCGFNNHHYDMAAVYQDWHVATFWREGHFALHTKHTERFASLSNCA